MTKILSSICRKHEVATESYFLPSFAEVDEQLALSGHGTGNTQVTFARRSGRTKLLSMAMEDLTPAIAAAVAAAVLALSAIVWKVYKHFFGKDKESKKSLSDVTITSLKAVSEDSKKAEEAIKEVNDSVKEEDTEYAKTFEEKNSTNANIAMVEGLLGGKLLLELNRARNVLSKMMDNGNNKLDKEILNFIGIRELVMNGKYEENKGSIDQRVEEMNSFIDEEQMRMESLDVDGEIQRLREAMEKINDSKPSIDFLKNITGKESQRLLDRVSKLSGVELAYFTRSNGNLEEELKKTKDRLDNIASKTKQTDTDNKVLAKVDSMIRRYTSLSKKFLQLQVNILNIDTRIANAIRIFAGVIVETAETKAKKSGVFASVKERLFGFSNKLQK